MSFRASTSSSSSKWPSVGWSVWSKAPRLASVARDQDRTRSVGMRDGLTISDIIIMIPDMKKPFTVQDIDEKILQLKNQLVTLGPLHPGSLSRQYQVCGRPGC